MSTAPFDVDAFLAEPNQVFVATNGPTIRPLWYLWEDGCFWIMSGAWAKLFARVQKDPKLALLIDTCDFKTGRVLQVMASGNVEIVPFDKPRARRLMYRYLGPDEAAWPSKPDDYRGFLADPGPPGISWLKLKPTTFKSFNFSFQDGTIHKK